MVQLEVFEVADTVMSKLNAINFEIAANTSLALSMMRFMVEAKQAKQLGESASCAKFLMTVGSSLNKPDTLKRLSCQDIENHILVIQNMLTLGEVKPAQRECLETELIEYLCNDDYVMRGKNLWSCF